MISKFYKNIIILLSTGFYSGYSPIAPGTAGTIIGLTIYFLLSGLTTIFYLLGTITLIFTGVFISTEAERIFNKKDSSEIVIDEIAGILITLFMVPLRVDYLIFGFILFRFFDIWKPFPRIENLPGGWGVMMDDVAAGVISNIILQIIIFIF